MQVSAPPPVRRGVQAAPTTAYMQLLQVASDEATAELFRQDAAGLSQVRILLALLRMGMALRLVVHELYKPLFREPESGTEAERFEEPAIQSARQSPESPWQSRPQPQLCYSLGRFVDRPHRSPHPSWQTAPPRRRQRPASAGPVRPSRKTSTVGDRRAPDMAPKVSFLQRIEAVSTPGTGVEPRLPRSPQGSPRSSMRARSQPRSPGAALGRGSRFYSAGVSTSPVSAAGSSVQSALRPSQRSERPRPYKDVPFPASRPRQPGAPKHGKLHAATAHAAAPLRSYHTTRRQYTRGGMSNQRALPAALAPRLLSRGRAEQGHFNRVHGGSGWE